MRILIIEDEKHTAQRLVQLIMEIKKDAQIVAVLNSVESSLLWFRNNEEPDLIFQDIQLGDGLCFEIYNIINIHSPIVFTTAYSEYALQSFDLNSISYIVKPYDRADLEKVFDKYDSVKSHFNLPETQLLQEILLQKKTSYKRRFLIKIGEQFHVLNARDIAFIVFEHGLSFAFSFQNQKFPLDLSMNELAKQLDPNIFFRINRQSIVNSSSIKKISNWFNARLKLETEPKAVVEFVVSREKVKDFKEWLND
jgi:two-component system response regulator LytT